MDRKMVLRGRGITRGVAEGKALVSKQPFNFPHYGDPRIGVITDVRHEWRGQSIRDKVLVFPHGKGSTSGGIWILESVKHGNAPAAIVNIRTEPIMASGLIYSELLYHKKIPTVDRLDQDPTELIKTGDHVRVNADQGTVEIIKK